MGAGYLRENDSEDLTQQFLFECLVTGTFSGYIGPVDA